VKSRKSGLDLASYSSGHTWLQLMARGCWSIVWFLLHRPSPTPLFAWRRFLLRLFGARIARGAHIYPSARIWAPWNLEMEEHSCLGKWVDCYCVDKITIGANATVSQYAYLCAAGHDISDPGMRLTTKPIRIERNAWVAAGAFIGPGVTIGEGAVIGARGCVFKSVRPWTVMGGNPAQFIKRRKLRGAHG